jgi:nucleoside-diphosphate-sugar epimerase
MAEATSFTGEPEYGPAWPGDVLRSALDPSKAEKVLDWRPWTTLEEGVKRTIAWFDHRSG